MQLRVKGIVNFKVGELEDELEGVVPSLEEE